MHDVTILSYSCKNTHLKCVGKIEFVTLTENCKEKELIFARDNHASGHSIKPDSSYVIRSKQKVSLVLINLCRGEVVALAAQAPRSGWPVDVTPPAELPRTCFVFKFGTEPALRLSSAYSRDTQWRSNRAHFATTSFTTTPFT